MKRTLILVLALAGCRHKETDSSIQPIKEMQNAVRSRPTEHQEEHEGHRKTERQGIIEGQKKNESTYDNSGKYMLNNGMILILHSGSPHVSQDSINRFE